MKSDIILDNTIYPVFVIDRGIFDYIQIAKFKIDKVGNNTILHIVNSKIDFTALKNEFCNYLIYIMSISIGK
jgi:hypothetical protein